MAFNQKYDLALNHPVFLNQQQSFRKFSDRQEVWCKDQSRVVHCLGLSRYSVLSVLNQLQMSDQFDFLSFAKGTKLHVQFDDRNKALSVLNCTLKSLC